MSDVLQSNFLTIVTSFTSNLRLFFNNAKLSDIILKVGSEQFFAHKVLLHARCQYFSQLLEKSDSVASELTIPSDKFSPEAIKFALQYIYFGDRSIFLKYQKEANALFGPTLYSKLRLFGTKDQISLDLKKFFNNDRYADAIFKVDSQTFYAHRVILACKSNYFFNQFCGEKSVAASAQLVEVKISNILPTTVPIMLEYMYSEKNLPLLTAMATDKIFDLFAAAQHYSLEHLKWIVQQSIGDHLTIENVSINWNLALSMNAPHLCDRCQQFVVDHIVGVLASSTFTQLKRPALKSALKASTIPSIHHEKLKIALLKWVAFNRDPSMTEEQLLKDLLPPFLDELF